MAGIGDLVANLGVNTAPWTKGLGVAKSQLSSFAGGMSSMIAPIAASLAGVWGVKESVSAASDALAAQRKLQAGLDATGGAAGLSAVEISDLADSLQGVTNFDGDDTKAAAAALTAFTNVRGDQFKGALVAAQDLTAIMGGDLEGNVKLLGKALNDPADGLTKLSKAGVAFTEDQKKQIAAMQESGDMLGAQSVILDALESKFGGAARATADPLQQLSFAVGDIAEGIGTLLLPTITVGAQALTSLIGIVTSGAGTFAEFGIEAAVQLSHIGEYIVLAATQWELFFVQIGAGASHFFTQSLPAYLDWFSSNWQNIFVTVASNTLTIFENLGTNIIDAMTKIWDFIASGGTAKLELAWTPLTTGFINTIDSLPDIPDRVVGEFEKSLMDSIESQSENLATSMADQRAKLTEQFSPLKTTKGDGTVPMDDLSNPTKAKSSAGKESPTLALRGSSEAIKSIIANVNRSNDPQQKLVAQGAQSLAEQKKTNGYLERQTRAEQAFGGMDLV